MTENETRLYGVSTGNGNDGVSHMFPDFYIRTNDPWNVARLQVIQQWTSDYWDWAAESVQLDGDADYCVYAVIYEDPAGNDQFSAAELIVDVFPVKEADEPDVSTWEAPMIYATLDDAFGADFVAKYAERDA